MKPTWTYYIAGSVLLVIFLTVWLVTNHSFFNKAYWKFFINPFVFITGVFLFFIFIDQPIVQHIYLIICCLGYYLLFSNIFDFLHQTKNYQPYALENIYSYLNISIIFFFSASAGGALAILGWPSWSMVGPLFVVGGYSFASLLMAYKIGLKLNWLFIIFAGLFVAETFYILSFLPSSFLFSSLVVTVFYYLVSFTAKDHLMHTAIRDNLTKYIVISVLIIIISLLTTRWY